MHLNSFLPKAIKKAPSLLVERHLSDRHFARYEQRIAALNKMNSSLNIFLYNQLTLNLFTVFKCTRKLRLYKNVKPKCLAVLGDRNFVNKIKVSLCFETFLNI